MTQDNNKSKERLELEKLENEIRDQNRPWWFKPAYIAAFSPLLLGALTVAITWSTGILSDAKRDNEFEKKQIQHELRTLNERRSGLHDSISVILDSLARYEGLLAQKNQFADSLSQSLLLSRMFFDNSMDSLLNIRKKLERSLHQRMDSISVAKALQSDTAVMRVIAKENELLKQQLQFPGDGMNQWMREQLLDGHGRRVMYLEMELEMSKRALSECRERCP